MLLAMKNKTLLITFLSAATFAVGCDKEKTTAQQIETVKTETKQAAQDMKDYTFAQKAEFVKAMQGQLTTLNQDLDNTQNATESTWDSVKADSKKAYETLANSFTKARQWVSDKIAP